MKGLKKKTQGEIHINSNILKNNKKKNITERNKERRESNRRNVKVQKKNVLKEIQEKEDVQT